MGRFFFVFLFLCGNLLSLEADLPLEITFASASDNRCSPLLKGIWLLSSSKDLNRSGYEELCGIDWVCMEIPGSSDNLASLLSRNYLGHPVELEEIQNIKRSIVQFYRNASRPIVAVIAPEQDLSSGVLQLLVIEAKVGKVEVSGNHYFSSQRLRNDFSLQSGEPICADVIEKDLAFINRNPFRRADLIFSPGENLGTTNLELIVRDRRTYRFYGGIDNTGNNITGNNRLFAGFNWGNVFGLDHVLSFQFSTSDDFKEFLGYTLHYTIPMPKRHTMEIYGGYSTVDSEFKISDLADSKFRNHGYNAQASFRYDIPLDYIYGALEELASGFDFKRTNNNLEFGGSPVFSKNINLFQLMASWNFGCESQKWVATLELEGFVSPGRWLPDQSNSTYETLRPFAKNQYVYGRASFSLINRFHNWIYYQLYLRGQAASCNLLPSEEYGVGGYDTVRGYQERQVNGDSAFVGNFELTSAPFALSRLFGVRGGGDTMQLLAFFDYGAAYIHKTTPGQKKQQQLYSFGPGLRYQIFSYCTVRTDWGFQLHRIAPGTPEQRLHFQLIASY